MKLFHLQNRRHWTQHATQSSDYRFNAAQLQLRQCWQAKCINTPGNDVNTELNMVSHWLGCEHTTWANIRKTPLSHGKWDCHYSQITICVCWLVGAAVLQSRMVKLTWRNRNDKHLFVPTLDFLIVAHHRIPVKPYYWELRNKRTDVILLFKCHNFSKEE